MRKKNKLVGIFNLIIVTFAVAYLLLALFFLINSAFEASVEYGLRSIAACFLPIIVMVFVSTYTSISKSNRYNPNINLFIIYSIWTMVVLMLGSGWQFGGVPLIEFLLSSILASIFKKTLSPNNIAQIYACCYGVIFSVLGFSSISGTSPFQALS